MTRKFAGVPPDPAKLPTARSNGGHDTAVTCNTCRHSADADYATIIAAGKGDVPLIHLKFRCSACGSRDCWFVMVGNGKVTWGEPPVR